MCSVLLVEEFVKMIPRRLHEDTSLQFQLIISSTVFHTAGVQNDLRVEPAVDGSHGSHTGKLSVNVIPSVTRS